MVIKVIKYGGVTLAALTVGGLVLFGTDLFSYAKTSVNEVRSSAKEAVPIDFELARARDLLDEVLPELHANVKLIAHEEVEIAELKSDIEMSEAALQNEKARISKLRDRLDGNEMRFVISGHRYDRNDMTQELSRSFDRYKDAEIALAGKQRLLETREKSLNAAIKMLDEAKSKKIVLEDRIAALEGQYRLVKAASQTSEFQIDDTKLAQTERLIQTIKKRLDVAERTLAHEAKFTEGITFEPVVDEQDLLAEVDDYFSPVPVERIVIDSEDEVAVPVQPRVTLDN